MVLILHGTSSAPPSYFKVDGKNRGTELKELPGRELPSGVRKSSSLRILPTQMGPVGQMEADRTWKALGVDSVKRKT